MPKKTQILAKAYSLIRSSKSAKKIHNDQTILQQFNFALNNFISENIFIIFLSLIGIIINKFYNLKKWIK